MLPLSPEQVAYIERRRRQIAYWPWLATLLVLVLAGIYVWLWLQFPWFLDPQALLQGLRNGSIDTNELATLAALGNLAFTGGGLLILVIILVTSVALWNEHRLIRCLDQLSPPPPPDGPAMPEAGSGLPPGSVPDTADSDRG